MGMGLLKGSFNSGGIGHRSCLHVEFCRYICKYVAKNHESLVKVGLLRGERKWVNL